MFGNLSIQVRARRDLSPELGAQVRALCNRAYEEDVSPLLVTFHSPVHVLGFLGGTLVSHAMWVTRWLEPAGGAALRTAYVEMVATEPRLQRRGYATAVMRELAVAIAGYDLGALCPAETGLYTKLGWAYWRGPLYIRSEGRLIATPDERIMVLRLPNTPTLDLDQPVSAEWRVGELW